MSGREFFGVGAKNEKIPNLTTANVSIVWKFCVLVNNVNNIKAPATGKDADSPVTESRS